MVLEPSLLVVTLLLKILPSPNKVLVELYHYLEHVLIDSFHMSVVVDYLRLVREILVAIPLTLLVMDRMNLTIPLLGIPNRLHQLLYCNYRMQLQQQKKIYLYTMVLVPLHLLLKEKQKYFFRLQKKELDYSLCLLYTSPSPRD